MTTKREDYYAKNEVVIKPLESKHIKDLTGQQFGRWNVIGYAGLDKELKSEWWCQCQCSNDKYYIRTGSELSRGKSKSCGCLIVDRNKQRSTIKAAAKKYNVSEDTIRRLGRIFNGMKQRCYNTLNKDYYKYGARGIKIYDEWLLDINKFYQWSLDNGYINGLTIDRIDVHKGYAPNNCRWVGVAEQNRNKTTTIYVEYKGETRTLSSVLHENGIVNNYSVYVNRITRYGWDIDKTLKEPIRTKLKIDAINKVLQYFHEGNTILNKKDFCAKHNIGLSSFYRYLKDDTIQKILRDNDILDNKKGYLNYGHQ